MNWPHVVLASHSSVLPVAAFFLTLPTHTHTHDSGSGLSSGCVPVSTVLSDRCDLTEDIIASGLSTELLVVYLAELKTHSKHFSGICCGKTQDFSYQPSQLSHCQSRAGEEKKKKQDRFHMSDCGTQLQNTSDEC